MPHFQLASKALYRVSRLPEALAALGYENNAAGYAQLENGLPRNRNPLETVSDRSIQLMMYQGQFLKHRKCAVIRDNIVLAAADRGLTSVVAEDFIDEHEWYISRFQQTLEQVAVYKKITTNQLVDRVAEASDQTSNFVTEMMKYRRCLKHEAEVVQAGLVAMAPELLVSGKARDGKIGVRVENEPLAGKDTLPIAWTVRAERRDED